MKIQHARKGVARLLTFLILCTALSLQIFAQTPEALYDYTVRSDNEKGNFAVLTKYKGNETDLVLPSEIGGYPVLQLAGGFIQNTSECGIETITIPATLETIFDYAITNIPTLQTISVANGNPNFFAEDGVLYDTKNGQTELILYPAAKPEVQYTVRSDTVLIGTGAFSGSIHLQTITLPEGLETICPSAFSKCTSLTTLKMPRTLKRIMPNAFQNCTALKTVWFSHALPTSSAIEIKDYAFAGCTALTDVFMPDDTYGLGANIFPQNDGLTLYGIQDSGAYRNIEDYAIASGISFQNIRIQIPNEAFENRSGTVLCAYDQTPLYLVVEKIYNLSIMHYSDVTVEASDANGNSITDFFQPTTDGMMFRVHTDELGYDLFYTVREAAMGDANRDGKITAVDARFLLQAASGARTFTDADCRIGDVNQDGKTNAVDARWILQIASGARDI